MANKPIKLKEMKLPNWRKVKKNRRKKLKEQKDVNKTVNLMKKFVGKQFEYIIDNNKQSFHFENKKIRNVYNEIFRIGGGGLYDKFIKSGNKDLVKYAKYIGRQSFINMQKNDPLMFINISAGPLEKYLRSKGVYTQNFVSRGQWESDLSFLSVPVTRSFLKQLTDADVSILLSNGLTFEFYGSEGNIKWLNDPYVTILRSIHLLSQQSQDFFYRNQSTIEMELDFDSIV